MTIAANDVLAQSLHYIDGDGAHHAIVQAVLLELSDGELLEGALDRYRLPPGLRKRVAAGVAAAIKSAEQELTDWEDAGMNQSLLGLLRNPLLLAAGDFKGWLRTL